MNLFSHPRNLRIHDIVMETIKRLYFHLLYNLIKFKKVSKNNTNQQLITQTMKGFRSSIEKETSDNINFRKVIYTIKHS